MAKRKYTRRSRRKNNDIIKRHLSRSEALKEYWKNYKDKYGKRITYVRTKEHRELMGELKKGKHYGEEWVKKISDHHADVSGSKNPNWKGGKMFTEDGRLRLYRPNHPFATKLGYVLKYRLVMEKHLGRYLTREEVIHHIDGDKTNDKLSNLMLFPNNAAHRRYHGKIK